MRPRLVLCFAVLLFPACTPSLSQTKPNFSRDYIYDSSGRLILTAERDIYGPYPPTGVSASFDMSTCEVDIDWNATTDIGSGVAKYNVYRNGSYIGQTTGLTYSDPRAVHANYTYTVAGVDNAGTVGAQSAGAGVTVYTCSPQAPTKPPSTTPTNPSAATSSSEPLVARLRISAFFRGVRRIAASGFKRMAAFGGGK
ncbi:MAG TPA: hypothetical protein VMG82_31645 [Candidatus Sulfotelmatobacter sp.]|nr:hypothetical protein [Candidatus Sulfotelmatobacter sp.]